MHGPRLAGVLTAVAVGPILIGFLLLWTWAIFKRRNQDLSQDPEATESLPSNEHYFSLRRIFADPPYDEYIENAIGQLRVHLNCIAGYCSKNFSKTSQAIPLSRLQSHLHELGDGEHRLPAERLVKLVPGQVDTFVSHIVITTVIGAITVSEKTHLTILHQPSVALLADVSSHGDPDDHDRSTVSAHLRECMAFLLPSEMSNQKATDRLTDLLTDLIGDSLGFHANDDEEFQLMLRDIFQAAIKLGTYFLRHPAEHRFDWVIGDPQSEEQVIVFPKIVRATDFHGQMGLRPLVFEAGMVRKHK